MKASMGDVARGAAFLVLLPVMFGLMLLLLYTISRTFLQIP
jgi:hypothetical protein